MPWGLFVSIFPPYLPRAPASKGVTEAAFGKAVSTPRASVEPCAAGLPPSLRERLRENLLSAHAFIAKRLAKAVFGSAFIALAKKNLGRHRAASHVAEPLGPRGQLTPAPCIQL